jgi:hypothetical protein
MRFVIRERIVTASFSIWRYRELNMDYYCKNMERDENIISKQLGNLMSISGREDDQIDNDVIKEALEVVVEYYGIIEAVITKADEILLADEFEPEVERFEKELFDFTGWLCILFKEMMKKGVKVVEKEKTKSNPFEGNEGKNK